MPEPCFTQRLLAGFLYHPAVADEDHFFDGELFSQSIDLFGYGGRIAGIAAEHAYRQRLSRRIGKQPNDDLQFALFPVQVIAKFAQRVVLAFQIGTGDVVENQGGRRAVAIEILAKESFLDLLLAGAEIVQSIVNAFFVELAQTEHFSDGVIASPTNGRQTRTLMADAGQDQEQGEFAMFGLAEGIGKTDVVCHLFEGVQETEDRPGGGFGQGNGIEFPAEEAAQSLNAQARPGSDVGNGAVLDLAVFAERLAKEDSGRRGAVGDFRDVHVFRIRYIVK